MAGFIVVRHALVVERAIVLAAEARMLEGMFAGLCGVACASGYERRKLALLDKASIEEGRE